MTVVLRRKVTCQTCQEQVNSNEARVLNPWSKDKEFECFQCFRKEKKREVRSQIKPRKEESKKELFCGHCKYKFKSSRTNCPYCGKSDFIVERNMTAGDFLD